MSFASNEGSFQAATRETCFLYLTNGVQGTEDLFSSLTGKLCKNVMDWNTQSALADLGPLNLFALTSGKMNLHIDSVC